MNHNSISSTCKGVTNGVEHFTAAVDYLYVRAHSGPYLKGRFAVFLMLYFLKFKWSVVCRSIHSPHEYKFGCTINKKGTT